MVGTFDSLNPFIVQGGTTSARGLVRSGVRQSRLREPARCAAPTSRSRSTASSPRSVETPPDRSWVEFTLNPKAKFSDGQPVTVDDVIFSPRAPARQGPAELQGLLLQGRADRADRRARRPLPHRERQRPRAAADPRPDAGPAQARHRPGHLRQVDAEADRSAPAPTSSREVKRARPHRLQAQSRLLGEGPADQARLRQLRRDPHRVLPRRQHHVRGVQEGPLRRQSRGRPGAVEHGLRLPGREGRPGRQGDVQDRHARRACRASSSTRAGRSSPTRRVREALAELFDFEWVNKNLYYGAFVRAAGYFNDSELSSIGRPADEREKALLAPFPGAVATDVMNGTYKPTVSDGCRRRPQGAPRGARRSCRRPATSSTRQHAGQHGDRRSRSPSRSSSPPRRTRGSALAYQRTLDRIGIKATIRSVDAAQFQQRRQTFDFDMIRMTWTASLSPGNEQNFRWSQAVGRRRRLVQLSRRQAAGDRRHDRRRCSSAPTREDFVAAVRALDRVLISGYYVVPLFYLPETSGSPAGTRSSTRRRPSLTGPRLETWYATPQIGLAGRVTAARLRRCRPWSLRGRRAAFPCRR